MKPQTKQAKSKRTKAKSTKPTTKARSLGSTATEAIAHNTGDEFTLPADYLAGIETPKAKHPKPTTVKDGNQANGLMKASDLLDYQFETLPFTGKWAGLLDNPAANMKVMIYGPPKNGKTSGSTKFARYLTNFGNVLYVFADQGYNKSTQDIIRKSGLAESPNAFILDTSDLDTLEKEIATGKYQFVFIDLLNEFIKRSKIQPHEFKDRFLKKYPDISFMMMMETTKTGNFKGTNDWKHLVDSIIEVKDFMMESSGRYGFGEYDVWPDAPSRTKTQDE